MNTVRKRAGGILLAAALTVSALPGMSVCAETQEETSAMGRYLEEEIFLGEGNFQILDVKAQNDGSVKALIRQDQRTSFMESSDNGVTWTKGEDLPEEMQTTETSYLFEAALSRDGEVFALYSEGMEEPVYTYRRCDAQGTVTEVMPSFLPEGEEMNFLYSFSYTDQGEIVTEWLGDKKIYLFEDSTGELIRSFNENENDRSLWAAVAGNLYLFNQENMYVFDLETGEELEDTVLRDAILEDPENVNVLSSSSVPMILAGEKGGESLYFCTKDGLYRHVKGGSVIEQLIDGNLTAMSNPAVGMCGLEVLADGSFLIHAIDNNSGTGKLLRYEFSPDTPAVPEKELTVYSLKENMEIRQVIAMFQKSHPEYYVDLEIGVSGQDAVTSSDALRTLNTDIMAGKGPDILILDGMEIGSYMEKGMLSDLAPVLQEVGQTDGFYENVLKTYEKDGGCYAVPSRFRIPMIQAKEESVLAAQSLTAFADALEQLRQEDAETPYTMSTADIYWMLKKLYGAYSPNFLTQEGGLNEEAVREFVTQSKRIYDLDEHTQETSMPWDFAGSSSEPYRMENITVDMSTLMMNLQRVGAGPVDSLQDMLVIFGMEQQNGLSYRPMKFVQGNVFIPDTIVGISSKSAHQEDAQEFVKFLFSKDAQAEGIGGGFPVNRAALAQNIEDQKKEFEQGKVYGWSFSAEGGGEMIDFGVGEITEQQEQILLDMTESLDTAALTDSIVENTIIEQTGNCIAGQMSEDEAVRSIMQKLNLYLSE